MKDRHTLQSQTFLVTLCIRYEKQHSHGGSLALTDTPIFHMTLGEVKRWGEALVSLLRGSAHCATDMITGCHRHTSGHSWEPRWSWMTNLMDDKSQLSACPGLDCGLGGVCTTHEFFFSQASLYLYWSFILIINMFCIYLCVCMYALFMYFWDRISL